MRAASVLLHSINSSRRDRRVLRRGSDPATRFQRLLPEAPAPERCAEAYYLPETGVGRDDYLFRLHSAIACERRPFDMAD